MIRFSPIQSQINLSFAEIEEGTKIELFEAVNSSSYTNAKRLKVMDISIDDDNPSAPIIYSCNLQINKPGKHYFFYQLFDSIGNEGDKSEIKEYIYELDIITPNHLEIIDLNKSTKTITLESKASGQNTLQLLEAVDNLLSSVGQIEVNNTTFASITEVKIYNDNNEDNLISIYKDKDNYGIYFIADSDIDSSGINTLTVSAIESNGTFAYTNNLQIDIFTYGKKYYSSYSELSEPSSGDEDLIAITNVNSKDINIVHSTTDGYYGIATKDFYFNHCDTELKESEHSELIYYKIIEEEYSHIFYGNITNFTVSTAKEGNFFLKFNYLDLTNEDKAMAIYSVEEGENVYVEQQLRVQNFFLIKSECEHNQEVKFTAAVSKTIGENEFIKYLECED